LAGNNRDLNITNAISICPELDVLIDHPSVFGKLLGLMGPYIQVTGTELLYRYQHDSEPLRLHTDGGPSLARIFPAPSSLVLNAKVQFFLTDVSSAKRGNMAVVHGTQRIPFRSGKPSASDNTKNLLQVLAEAGDAIVFPWSLWHAAAPNRSETTRITAIVRFAQMWARPVDYGTLPSSVIARMTARRRRLFGDMDEPHRQEYFYKPTDRHHLETMLGEEWARSPEAGSFFQSEAEFRELYKK